MTITRQKNGKYRVNVKWGAKYKGFGVFDEFDDAKKRESEVLAERPPTIPASRTINDPDMDTLKYLQQPW
jgi:hypothetical protein